MTDGLKLPLTGWKTDDNDPRYFGEPGKVVSDEHEPTAGEGSRCVVLSANMNGDNRAEVAELAARAPALVAEVEAYRDAIERLTYFEEGTRDAGAIKISAEDVAGQLRTILTDLKVALREVNQ